MNSVQVSVIVPIYNAENFIEECAKSILGQTFKNLELILVDDGSKDNSLQICQRIANEDSRVKVFTKENGGTSSAKNFGIENAQGEYIAFCDADDTIDAEYIENLYQGVALYDADVCVGNVSFVSVRNDEIISRRTVKMVSGKFSMKEFMSYYPQYMPNAVIGAPWNKLYKRSIILENGFRFNTKIKNNEDTHFNYAFLAKCKTVYSSEMPYYNYINRLNVASASKGFIPNIFDIYTLTYNKALDFLKATDTYSQNIQFQNQYYIGLVIGAINGIVNGKNDLTVQEKIEQIENICNTKEVKEAIKTVKFSDPKKTLIAFLIKKRCSKFLYYLVSLKK